VGQSDLFWSVWLRTNDESVWHLCQVLDDQRQRFYTRERSPVRQPVLLGLRATFFRLFHVFQPVLEHAILEQLPGISHRLLRVAFHLLPSRQTNVKRNREHHEAPATDGRR
jgi:hypothetical protein